jgi:hypothetical protein
MDLAILQVRDVPVDVVETLRDRAKAQGVSLSAYVRALLATEAAQQPLEDVVARISSRAPVDISDEDLVSAIHEGRG